MNTLQSPAVTQVLDRLFADAKASEPALDRVAKSDAAQLLTSKTEYRQFYAMLKDFPLPVSRETGGLLYMLTRATGAASILEFGTSFGVSTIFLAAALRDTGRGRIITTEFEPSKATRARQNLAEAGLLDLVDIRQGDALVTLTHDLPKTFDLVLLDGAKGLYADVLDLIEPRLHPGSLVIADDANRSPQYVERLRSDSTHYSSVPLAGDLELTMRIR